MIGDPGFMGWLIVMLYAATSLFAFAMLVFAPFPGFTRRQERVFWFVLGLIMAALAINKQLDLQSFLTSFARCLSQLQGWYQDRRPVQASFIIGVMIVMLVALIILWLVLRDSLRRNWLPLLGLVFVLGFVAMRAAGFHDFDRLINFRIANMRMNWALEMVGPVIVILGGILSTRSLGRAVRQ